MTRRSRFYGHCRGCDEQVTTTYPDRDHTEIVMNAFHDCGDPELVVRERGDDAAEVTA